MRSGPSLMGSGWPLKHVFLRQADDFHLGIDEAVVI